MSNKQEIVRPTECPECKSTDICVSFGRGPSFALDHDGIWIEPSDVLGKTFAYDWSNAEYECENCYNEWIVKQG